MVGLARAIYNPRPGELTGTLRDPAELRDQTDRAAVQSLLFDAFIPAAYRHNPASRWTAEQAERWLVFLACHLDYAIGGADIAWWQLRQAVSRTTLRCAAGLMFGLAAGLAIDLAARFKFGIGLGLVYVLGGGLAGGLALRSEAGLENAKAPSRGMRVPVRGLIGGLVLGLTFGLTTGLTFSPGVGLGVGLAAGLTFGLGLGLAPVPGEPAAPASPRAVLARDRQVALLLMFGPGAGLGLMCGLWAGLAAGPAAGLWFGPGGLMFGLGLGLLASWTETAWPSYMLTRGQLAFHQRLPWSLMSFVADAHQRGVLRQAGAVYQFRHIDLQHRLAVTKILTSDR